MKTTEEATETGFDVVREGGGILLSWSDDPLDYIWQSDAQIRDLVDKLAKALGGN